MKTLISPDGPLKCREDALAFVSKTRGVLGFFCYGPSPTILKYVTPQGVEKEVQLDVGDMFLGWRDVPHGGTGYECLVQLRLFFALLTPPDAFDKDSTYVYKKPVAAAAVDAAAAGAAADAASQ